MNANSPAFPRPGFDGTCEAVEPNCRNKPEEGMTLRTYLAAKAMAALLTNDDAISKGCAAAVSEAIAKGQKPMDHAEVTAKAACHYADVLIAELSKP